MPYPLARAPFGRRRPPHAGSALPLVIAAMLTLHGCGGGGGGSPVLPGPTPTTPAPGQHTLTLQVKGVGRVDSVPEGGFTCGASCMVEFVNGTSLRLRATPAAGQSFDGWLGDCSGSASTCDVRLDRDVYVSAVFTAAPHAGWGAEQAISAGGADEPRVSIDSRGRALAVWSQVVAGSADRRLMASTGTAGGWSAPLRVDTGGADAAFARLAMEPSSGRAVLMWRQLDGTADLWARPYDPATGWGAPVRVDNQPGSVGQVEVGMDAQGNAVAAWEQIGPGTRISLYGARFSAAAGGWSVPVLLETNETVGSVDGSPALAVAPSGDAVVVWKRSDGVSGHLWTNRFTATSGWGTAVEVVADAGSSQFIGGHALALDARGQGLLVWGQVDVVNGNATSGLQFKRLTDGAWQAGSTPVGGSVPTRQGYLSQPVLAMNAAGTALLAWRREDNSVMAATTVAGAASFGTPVQVRAAGTPALTALPTVGIDAAGNGLLAWTDNDLWLARLTGGAWLPAALNEEKPGETGTPALSMTEGGAAVLAWRQFITGEGTRIFARLYGSP